MKQRLFKFHYGSKGVAFTIDVMVALTVFLLAIVVSLFQVSQAPENKIGQIQMSAAASDLMAALDNTGALQTFDESIIANKTKELLQPGYDMRIVIYTNETEGLEVGRLAPQEEFTLSGVRYFASEDQKGQARYWIWVKE